MKQFIKTVTLTGADNSIAPQRLQELSDEFPFVEWGILLSESSVGGNRFPSVGWIEELYKVRGASEQLSAHICGKWVRDLCVGNLSLYQSGVGPYLGMFRRMQLNFHAYTHKVVAGPFIDALNRIGVSKQFIFQLDAVNDNILVVALKSGIDAVGLFDLSGGAGLLPDEWPESSTYTGYAGGLSPDNVVAQLEHIEPLCKAPIWIDAETHVRSDRDQLFDLRKVRAFLKAIEPYVLVDK